MQRSSRRLRRSRGLDIPLENPRVVWRDLLVVVFVQADLGEPVARVEPLRVFVGYLDMEIDRADFWLRVRRGGVDEMLQALRSDPSGKIWLGDTEQRKSEYARLRFEWNAPRAPPES